MFSMAIAVSLMGRPLGVEATGRQLLATTNTSGIYYSEQHQQQKTLQICHDTK